MHSARLFTSQVDAPVKTETCTTVGGLLRFLPQQHQHRLHKLLKNERAFSFSFREMVPPLEVEGRFIGLDGSGNWLIKVEKIVSCP